MVRTAAVHPVLASDVAIVAVPPRAPSSPHLAYTPEDVAAQRLAQGLPENSLVVPAFALELPDEIADDSTEWDTLVHTSEEHVVVSARPLVALSPTLSPVVGVQLRAAPGCCVLVAPIARQGDGEGGRAKLTCTWR